MTVNEFLIHIQTKQKEIEKLMNRTLPIKVGKEAKSHFQQNFRKGGFMNNGIQKWKPSKRLSKGGKKAKNKHKTLLSSRNHLYSSIIYVPGNAEVKIQDKVPYAIVHNEGLRAGRGKGFQMPKRQFIGNSVELNRKVEEIIQNETKKILEL